ncbi:tetratricopeptide repeat protein [Erythrobacter sp.]|uniref:tetratricopeptide repeat protein n=1 Tax=Erythrobacter sp. TaxID=1042 RepID=UPI0025EB0CD8|nr:tetratricopeptide repeat protein [Erythrobacter sp.]
MTTASPTLRPRLLRVMLAAATIAVLPAPVFAQDTGDEVRLRKLEAEVRALQRKVFPGGDGRFFEPQIAPASPQGSDTGQVMGVIPPTTTPVTDILVRLQTLEAQLQTLTARSEEQANQFGLLEQRIAVLESRQTAAPMGTNGSTMGVIAPEATLPTAAPAAADPAPTPSTAVAAPSPERLAAVQAIAKPQTADAGDDEYTYGFRLWDAELYPEARQQLTRYVEQYPNHSRISFGRNLLGRAFLDDNMPEEAARWFLRNYQADKDGARGADSLLYLAQSMIAMGDTRRACIALAEFGATYPVIASGRLADEYQANSAKVTCS